MMSVTHQHSAEIKTTFLPAPLMPYPINQWYVAAGRDEVGRKPLRRKLLDRWIVLFRDEAGQAVALDDHCPHRGFPLSRGTLIGDTIQCGYHGMRFDPTGKCVKIAGKGKIPDAMRVQSYPIVEKWHWSWLWLGDPAGADAALIPDEENQHRSDYQHSFYFTLPFYGNWQLAHENLLDSTHASFLHAGLLDTEENQEFSNTEKKVTVSGDVIEVILDMPDFVPSKPIAEYFHIEEGGIYDRRVISRHYLPGMVNVINRFYEHQSAVKDKFDTLISEHITSEGITPADHNNGYHFRAVSTNYTQDTGDLEIVKRVLLQDVEAFAAIQEYFDTQPEHSKEVFVDDDRLGGLARAKIAAMVRSERKLRN